MNELLETLKTHEAMLYEETWLTIEMVLGAGFIALVAGSLLALILFQIKQVGGILSLLTWPIRAALYLLGSYPLIVMTILLIPVARLVLSTSMGPEAGQFILTIWGIFFFSSLLLRSFTQSEDDRKMPAKVVSNIRLLLVMLISGNAVLGLLGMGGLGEVLVHYAYQRYDLPLTIVIGLIYLFFIAVIELVFTFMLNILNAKITQKSARVNSTASSNHGYSTAEHLTTGRSTTDGSTTTSATRETGNKHQEQGFLNTPDKREYAPTDLDFLVRKR